ncbi:unnamed protein product [Adineta steineri]|uniref:Uncharacterized protein n=1 Tax=Adineta steineri TaxID=433720 RepID=A0A813U6A5_9BILA|nr:unnamed protein product [Adineta steineri]CAF0818952.1 unnamed protein product [Adineta steineri]
MQRLTCLRSGIPELHRVVDICQQTISSNTKRCLSNISSNNNKKNENDLGIDTKIYKPSTATTQTHIPDNLKGGQPTETIETIPKSTATLTGGGHVWSVQNPNLVHIAPLGATSTQFASAPLDGKTAHETLVHATQGELNIADPFTTHTLHGEATPGQLAEAAAASAFETFAPDTPMTSAPTSDTVFAPKISSTDVYSSASSPTGQFENAVSSSTSHHDYETSTQSHIYGGQDTSASTKTHQNISGYNVQTTDKTRQKKQFLLLNKTKNIFL